jgi:hypothetical protein
LPISISDIESEDFFRSLAPDLAISDGVTIDSYPIDNAASWSKAGHVTLPGVVAENRIAPMRSAVRALIACGLHPTFAYVYDAFWEPAVALRKFSERVLGPCDLLGDGWAWLIPPGPMHRGWPAHRDDRGPEKMITLWIALSDTDTDNACIHIVPLDRDPGYVDGLPKDDSSTEHAIPLIAAAGSALVWDSHSLHWGGASSDRARSPRISFSFTYASAARAVSTAVEPRVALEPRAHFPFKARLDVIAAMIVSYRHQERLPPPIDDWATMVFGLRVILRKNAHT